MNKIIFVIRLYAKSKPNYCFYTEKCYKKLFREEKRMNLERKGGKGIISQPFSAGKIRIKWEINKTKNQPTFSSRKTTELLWFEAFEQGERWKRCNFNIKYFHIFSNKMLEYIKMDISDIFLLFLNCFYIIIHSVTNYP